MKFVPCFVLISMFLCGVLSKNVNKRDIPNSKEQISWDKRFYLHIMGAGSPFPTSEDDDDMDGGIKTRPGGGGLEPLFEMIYIFINDMLVPKTIGDFIDEYELEKISDFADIKVEDWKRWSVYVVGMGIALSIGLVLMIVMPLCCCCYCCCRTCCHTQPTKQSKNAKCKRITCGTILFTTASIMCALVVCVYFTNEMIFHELGPVNNTHPNNAPSDVIYSIENIIRYLDTSLNDIDQEILKELSKTREDVFVMMYGLADEAITTLETQTGVHKVLESLQEFGAGLGGLNTSLGEMVYLRNELISEGNTLDTKLVTAKSDINDILTTECLGTNVEDDCASASSKLDDMGVKPKYDSLYDMSPVLLAITTALDEGLDDTIRTVVTTYDNFTREINQTSNDEISSIEDEVIQIENDIQKAYDEIVQTIQNVSLDEAVDIINEGMEIIDPYVDYIRWGYIGVNTLLLLVPICLLLGLLCGATCQQPNPARSGCTTKCGATCIMFGVAFTFILFSLFMLFTIIFFSIGSTMEFGVCRHLRTYDDSMQKLERLVKNEFENDLNYSIEIRELLDDCKDNKALYTAFNLENNGFDIEEVLDLSKLREFIEEIKNKTIDFDDIELITPELNETLIYLDSVFKSVDFSGYRTELDEDITGVNLVDYALELREIAIKTTDPLKKSLNDAAENLETIQSETVNDMETSTEQLKMATAYTESVITNIDLSQLSRDLASTELEINANGSVILKTILEKYVDDMYDKLEAYINRATQSIKNDIGKCKPVYVSLRMLIDAPCMYVLYPFNAYWFCWGGMLMLSLLGLIFGTRMVDYYREPGSMDPKVRPVPRSKDWTELQEISPQAAPPADYDNPPSYEAAAWSGNTVAPAMSSGPYDKSEINYHNNGVPYNLPGMHPVPSSIQKSMSVVKPPPQGMMGEPSRSYSLSASQQPLPKKKWAKAGYA